MPGKKRRPIFTTSLPILFTILLMVAGLFILQISPALANNVYQTLPFAQNWSNTGMITANDDWSGVPGIIGYLGDYTTASPTGVDPQTLLLDYAVTVDVIANQANPNTLTSGGVAEFDGIADPVVAMQGSGTADAPFLLLHLNTTGLGNIRVRYNVRDIDGSADNAVQPVALHYRVGHTGNFTNLPGGYIPDATTGPSLATLVTPIDVTLPAAANNKPEVQLRIMTTNAVGSDEWVGIDDISITGTIFREFGITKSAPALVSPGSAFLYTLSIENSLQMTATNVVITDALPANTSFVSASDGGVFADGVISWAVASMGNGAVVQRSFQVTAGTTAGQIISNDDYQVHADNWLTQTFGAPVETMISPLEVSIVKTSPAYGFGDRPLAYTVEVNFAGVAPAAHVLVTDTLPANVTYASDTSGVTPSFPVAGLVVWNFGDVPTTTQTIQFTLVVTPSGTLPNNTVLTNQVEVSTDTPGDSPDNNTAQAQTTIYQIVPIATARAGVPPQIFAVEGYVTFVPGTYSASDWGLQDESGGIVGYFNPPPSVALGDHVRLLAGRLDYSGQEEMGTPFLYFADLGSGPEVAPTNFSTGQVAAGVSEGWLTHIEGTVFNLPTCSTTANYSFNVDDGSGLARVYMDKDVGLDVCAMGAENGKMIRITGFSSQYSSNYELRPRRASDIDVAANNPTISKQAPAMVAPGAVFTYTITVENRLGYTLNDVTVVDNLPANVSSVEGSMIVRSLGKMDDKAVIHVSFPVTATNQITVVLNSDYFVTATEFLTPTYGAVATTFIVSGSLQIHDIQGPGHTSPFVGQRVDDIRGVVTMRLSSGFYMQDITPDANPATSEGIYVYTGGAPTVLVGDDVSLSGLVVEFNGMTELTTISDLTIYGSGISVVFTPVTLPVPVGTDLEPYESMLVSFPQTLTVGQNYFQGRYGQVTLSLGRMFNPTNGNGLGDTVEYNLRRMVVLDDGSTAQYPNPIPYIGQDNTLRAGDTVVGVAGILDYGPINSDTSIRFYRVQPTTAPTFTRVNERTASPDAIGGSLKVASMNVLNYFNGDGQGGGFPAPRGATTYEEFVRQRTKIIAAIVALNADVVGLMEIENDGDGSLSAIQDLVNGLNEATVPGTYAFISEPGPGDDQIKVAMIYKPATVTTVGPASNYQVYDHPVYQPLFDRPPLVQEFSVNATGETFFVIVNHFKSKGSCPTNPTDPDAEYGQGCWNVKRVAQANGLLDLIAGLRETTGEPDAMIIGDLNAYGEEDPILALTNGGIVNELAERVPTVDRYSYVFDGQSGYLDQGLVTASLADQVSGATIWHINADEPEIINYMTGKPQDLYTPTPYRSSDHDPVLLGLDLRPAALVIDHTVTPLMDVDLGGTVTYAVTLTNESDVSAVGVVVTDVLPAELSFGGWIVQNGAAEAGNQWEWNGDLPASGEITFVYTATLDMNTSLYGSLIANVVHFDSLNDGAASASVSFSVIAAPVLSINKTVETASTPPAPGEWITYTVAVANAGPATAWNVHITDVLPDSLLGTDVNITVTIPAGNVYDVVIPAMILPEYALYGTTVTNLAAYGCSGVGSGTAEASFEVVGAPVLSILKTVELAHDPALPGDPLTYTIALSNAGPADAVDVHVTDVLPDEVIGGDVDANVTVPSSGEYLITVPGVLSPDVIWSAVVTNTAAFSFMGAVSGEDSISFTVIGAPSLSIAKSVELSRDPIQPGDALTYTITVSNQGVADAAGVHITDALPADVIGASVDVTVTVPGSSDYVINVPAQLAQNAVYGAVVTNTATYEYKGQSGQAQVSFTVAGAPELQVAKTVELERIPAQPGDVITYTITITNLGASDALGVHIVDVLPEGIIGESVDVTVTISAGEVYQLVIPAVVAVPSGNGVNVTNTVYVYHPSGDVSATVSFEIFLQVRLFLPLIARAP